MKNMAPSGAAPPLPAALRDVILWALCNAGYLVFGFVFSAAACTLASNHMDMLSWLLPRPAETADAEVTEALLDALMTGMLCCCALQVAAGAPALKLSWLSRRIRLLLAYVALVATVAGHGMMATGILSMFVAAANPGGLFFWIAGTVGIYVFAVDLRCFLSLLRLRGGEEE